MGTEDRALRVLLATDGDRAADEAVALVSAIARRTVEFLVASVVPTGVPMVRHLRDRVGPLQERRRRARAVADRVVADLERAGFRASARTPEGRPDAALTRLAEAEGADVIVVGATNHGPATRLLGSVSQAVVAHASTAVLVVREAVTGSPTPVLFAVDDRRRAAAAIEIAARLLDPTRCHVTILGVAEVLAPALSPPHVRYATTPPDDEHPAVIATRTDVAEAAARLRSLSYTVDERVVAGEPVRRILAEAADRGAGLVVLGGRSLGSVESTLLGSVSRAVVTEAPATLVVRG